MIFFPLQYSLIYNLTPDKRGTFRAARTNFLFILLMLFALFLILLPIGYIIGRSVWRGQVDGGMGRWRVREG